jgi:hypothetical protein
MKLGKVVSICGVALISMTGLTPNIAHAASNGGKCYKSGIIEKTKGVTYVCKKMGGRLQWAAQIPSVLVNGYQVGPGANLQNANLQNANLAGLNLSGANLIGANLIGANLQGSNLSSANLYGANLGSANLRSSNLRNANFTSAELNRVDMRGADVSGTVFTNASYFQTILPDGSTR